MREVFTGSAVTFAVLATIVVFDHKIVWPLLAIGAIFALLAIAWRPA